MFGLSLTTKSRFIKFKKRITLHMYVYKYVITASESAQHQCVNEEEFYDVNDHAAQRYLKWSQVRVYAEYVHELQETIKLRHIIRFRR